MNAYEKFEQRVWRVIYKFFTTVQRPFQRWHKKGRQRYHIGWLAPGKTLEGLKRHLHSKWGFGNHFVAWQDEGQVLSWRKLADFQEQYHLRVFSDGEIRGHYEYTPEAHPIAHFDEKGESPHHAQFIEFLGDFVTKEKHISHLVMDPDAFNPDSEITI